MRAWTWVCAHRASPPLTPKARAPKSPRSSHPPPRRRPQVDSYARPKYSGMLDCAQKILSSEGAAGLFRGFGPAMMRSFPANAACFATYEAVSAALFAES